MKNLYIEKLPLQHEMPEMSLVDAILAKSGIRIPVDVLNWSAYSYKPLVSVAAAYGERELYLRYEVIEDYFKAEMTLPNENVYEDSCVEFFVSPLDDGIYYNFEFNALGTCLLGSGTGRADSKRADAGIISRIRRLGSFGVIPVKETEGQFSWTLAVAIPYEVFFRHSIVNPEGKSFRVNFYKCGDGLSVPHYVTWNPVKTENPDFHRPEYFGSLHFR